jgi:hypothetical protein
MAHQALGFAAGEGDAKLLLLLCCGFLLLWFVAVRPVRVV